MSANSTITGIDLRGGLPPYPDGWYVVAFAEDIAAGELVARKLAGNELVVFRTQSGQIAVVDAYCPHMGAHFAKGGSVEGDVIRCPFHGFCFDTAGTCVSTEYGTKPPPKAKLRSWPVREKHGLVLVYFDNERREPEWEVPTLDGKGYGRFYRRTFTIRSHPQETTENSVDMGHLRAVHGYSKVHIWKPIELHGPYLNIGYSMARKNPWVGPEMAEAKFEIHVWGLGYSQVDVETNQGVDFRLFILPRPLDGERIELTAAISMKRVELARLHPLARVAPQPLVQRLIEEATIRGIAHDVGQDFDIWENKVYIHPPPLAKGDGPIAQYRRYCRQFYPGLRRRSRGDEAEVEAAE